MKAFAAPEKITCSQCSVINLPYCFFSQPDERAVVMVSWVVCKNMSVNEFSIFSFLCFHASILKDVLFSKIVIKMQITNVGCAMYILRFEAQQILHAL